MAAIGGPRTVTDGLVLELDAANQKSYGPAFVEALVIGGGGGGGSDMGGGGGGGGVVYNTGVAVLAGTAYSVTVGAGGAGAPAGTGGHATTKGTNGGNSTVSGSGYVGITAIGGGAAGTSYYTFGNSWGNSGGSGGGGSGYNNGVTPALATGTGYGASGEGTAGQGNRGGWGQSSYYSGGGGGAGGAGTDANSQPNGGPGIANSILGVTYFWAGGGGGAAYSLGTGGNGGIGGGGGGAVGVTTGGAGLNPGSPGGGGSPNSPTNTPGGNGGTNTGGGGGGGSHYNFTNKGGDGGSGIVIIRYAGPQKASGGTITSVNGDTVHTFTTSGTFTTGTNWGDGSGNNNTGALTNGPTYSSANGGSIVFDGTNDYASILNNTALDNQAVSVEVWIKTNATTQNGFWFEKGTVNSQYALFQEGPNIQWRLGPLGDLSTTTASYMNTTNWYQVVGTYISGDRRLYINGVQVNSNATTGALSTNAAGMTIGCYGGGGYMYNGSISVVKVYSRNLSANEVKQNFNAYRARFGI